MISQKNKRTAAAVLLVLALFAGPCLAADVVLSWTPDAVNTDGTTITDLAGYRLFVATSSLLGMTTVQAAADPSVSQTAVAVGSTTSLALAAGSTYFLRLTAYNAAGLQSAFNVDSTTLLGVQLSTYVPAPSAGAGGGVSASTAPFWVYYNGQFNWGGDYSGQGASVNYSSTGGSPESGPYDIAFTGTAQWSEWLPYAGGTVPTWDFNGSAYNYLTLDLKPTAANQTWSLYFVQVGDHGILAQNGQPESVSVTNYGPAPVVGKWATYRIPLTAVLTQWSSGSGVLVSSAIYKFGLQDQTGLSSNLWYIDNVGFIASSAAPSGAAPTAPTVSIASPAGGATVSGTVSLSGTAAESGGTIAAVAISIDSGPYSAAAGTTQWSYAFNTATLRNGAHTITARVTDVLGATAAASVTATFANRHHVRVVGSPTVPGQDLFTVLVDTTIDPSFPLSSALAIAVGMPSGNKNLTLSQWAAGTPIFTAEEPAAMFTGADLFAAGGTTLTITVGAASFNAQLDPGTITSAMGGEVGESSGAATVAFMPGALAADAQITIEAMPPDTNGARARAMSSQGFAPAGAGREIVMTSSGGFTTAVLTMPFDPTQIPAGRSSANLIIGYFNPATSQWQAVDNATVAGNSLRANVTHFSQYAPLVVMPQSSFGLQGSLAYPNPAVQQPPTIRAIVGAASSVKITVFDAAGRVVHSATLSGAPTGVTPGGQSYYDHTWSGSMASGVYSAVIHAVGPDGSVVKARVQFAVIR